MLISSLTRKDVIFGGRYRLAATLSMEALINNAAVPSPARFPNGALAKLSNRQLKAFTVRCLGSGLNQEEQNVPEERLELPNYGPRTKSPDIWKLFKEAQQNILYLNKQRMRAIEELNRTNQEKLLLLDKIKQLEEKRQVVVKIDNLSFGWELLLRIDSMVLASKVNAEEASDLRKLVMGCRTIIADIFPHLLEKGDAELFADLRNFTDGSRKNRFHIIHICTEMEPLVLVGSLASYITGLSSALQRKGHMEERIMEIGTKSWASKNFKGYEKWKRNLSYFNGQLHRNRIWTGVAYGIGVTFIDPIDYSSFFSRDWVYGYSDDFERFSYFSRASLDYLIESGKKPDVIHIHNWETSIIGPLFWDIFAKQGLESTRILLTCHDLKSQVSCILHEESDIALKALKATVWSTTRRDIQFIFMRISKLNIPDRVFQSFSEETKDDNVRFLDGYDELVTHLVFAGSDIILCSFHDTTLQVPLKALKYGAAPIAFAPDEDRFRHFVDRDLESSKYSQFIRASAFGNMSLNQAIGEMKSDPSKWKLRIADAMEKDFWWDSECFDVHISAYSALKNL